MSRSSNQSSIRSASAIDQSSPANRNQLRTSLARFSIDPGRMLRRLIDRVN
jgi:hypothetical protein